MSNEARLVLVSLAAGPKHGYAIGQDIAVFAGRHLGPGTLYGAIGRLEASGLIEPLAGQPRRRPYRLTAGGRRVLKAEVSSLRRISSTASRRLAV
jgi:DNA-binding PadR family transcriptional regulator